MILHGLMAVIAEVASRPIGGGGGGPTAPFISLEDVFAVNLMTPSTGQNRTVVSGIDLSTYGGAVHERNRSGFTDHWWFDTARGLGKFLRTNGDAAEEVDGSVTGSFN